MRGGAEPSGAARCNGVVGHSRSACAKSNVTIYSGEIVTFDFVGPILRRLKSQARREVLRKGACLEEAEHDIQSDLIPNTNFIGACLRMVVFPRYLRISCLKMRVAEALTAVNLHVCSE